LHIWEGTAHPLLGSGFNKEIVSGAFPGTKSSRDGGTGKDCRSSGVASPAKYLELEVSNRDSICARVMGHHNSDNSSSLLSELRRRINGALVTNQRALRFLARFSLPTLFGLSLYNLAVGC